MPHNAGRQNKSTWKPNQGLIHIHTQWRSTSLTPPQFLTHVRMVFGNVFGSLAEFRLNISGDTLLSTLHTHNKCARNPMDRCRNLRRSTAHWAIQDFPDREMATHKLQEISNICFTWLFVPGADRPRFHKLIWSLFYTSQFAPGLSQLASRSHKLRKWQTCQGSTLYLLPSSWQFFRMSHYFRTP